MKSMLRSITLLISLFVVGYSSALTLAFVPLPASNIVLAEAMSAATPTPTPTFTTQDLVAQCSVFLERGKALLAAHETGDCTKGIKLLREIMEASSATLKLQPDNAEACYCRGMARRWLEEELSAAIADLECAVRGQVGNKAEAEMELARLRERVAAPISVSMGPPIFALDWKWDEGEPVGPGTTFPANKTKEVWARWTLSNPKDEVAVVKWYHDVVHVCQHYSDELRGSYDGSGWIADEEWIEPGQWCVKVYIVDRLMTEGCFTIATPTPVSTLTPTPEPTPTPTLTPTPIPKQHFKDKYDLEVKDGDKVWSADELRRVDEVLKNLPAGLRGKESLKTLKRQAVEDGTYGDYDRKDRVIQIFDKAYNDPIDFTGDKFKNHKGKETQFKGTLVHELIHAIQYYDAKNKKMYPDAYDNPLVQNYMKITGWALVVDLFLGFNWGLSDEYKSGLPTNYAGTNPKEDMAESAMLYMFDPERLKKKSQIRYDWLKKHVFENIEYENGKKKEK